MSRHMKTKEEYIQSLSKRDLYEYITERQVQTYDAMTQRLPTYTRMEPNVRQQTLDVVDPQTLTDAYDVFDYQVLQLAHGKGHETAVAKLINERPSDNYKKAAALHRLKESDPNGYSAMTERLMQETFDAQAIARDPQQSSAVYKAAISAIAIRQQQSSQGVKDLFKTLHKRSAVQHLAPPRSQETPTPRSMEPE